MAIREYEEGHMWLGQWCISSHLVIGTTQRQNNNNNGNNNNKQNRNTTDIKK